jgi:hypothetical protein
VTQRYEWQWGAGAVSALLNHWMRNVETETPQHEGMNSVCDDSSRQFIVFIALTRCTYTQRRPITHPPLPQNRPVCRKESKKGTHPYTHDSEGIGRYS